MRYCAIVLTFFLIVSCNTKMEYEQGSSSINQNLLEIGSLPDIDTTIVLKEITQSNFSKNLTDSIARETLYAYFESKDYYNSNNLPDAGKVTDSDLIVDFNKIYLTELNDSKCQDAIITYWLALDMQVDIVGNRIKQ